MAEIAHEWQALLVQHLEALLVRANSGEFSKIPEKRGVKPRELICRQRLQFSLYFFTIRMRIFLEKTHTSRMRTPPNSSWLIYFLRLWFTKVQGDMKRLDCRQVWRLLLGRLGISGAWKLLRTWLLKFYILLLTPMTNFPTCKIQRWIPIEWVESTNPSVDIGVVYDIFRNFSFDTFGALPWIFIDNKFRITDGNHRLRAARLRGHKYIPIIILTQEEYDHISFSKNTIDFMVFRSDFIFLDYPSKICTKLPLV